MGTTINPEMMEKLALGMVQEGLITADQLAVARVRKEDLGEDLGHILVKKGFVTEQQILGFIGKYLSIPYVSLKKYAADPALIKDLPTHLIRRHHILPLRRDGNEVVVAMSDPLNLFAIEEIRDALHAEIRPVLASSKEIEEAIGRFYRGKRSSDISLDSFENIGSDEGYTLPEEGKRLEEIATGPKVVQEVNEMIARAYQEGASDIHLEPNSAESLIRYRIDGLLEEKKRHPREMHLPIVSRIKIMSGLDIAERRVPQDGRVRVKMGGKPLDLRVSTYPTIHGEKIVLRLLSTGNPIVIESLGFGEQERKTFAEIITLSHGIFLVTGPTGSGKSTTLYAALERLNSPEKNIISIEDPVERAIPGVTQAQVSAKAGVSFASALRAILRQDPDVIMLGEIRDRETAEIAVRAAITGHMVLSTLHTNTTSGSISRLLDLGVEPFLLSSALVGILAQRLVRKICAGCREEIPPPDFSLVEPLAGRVKKFYRGKGCNQCRFSGFSGRIGIFELAPIRGAVRALIDQRASDAKVEEEFRRAGVRAMLEDGLAKVEAGITTIEEVLKVTQEET